MTAVALAPVPAAFAWPSNAELIADVARLGYLRSHDRVLDPTFEKGVWWQLWRPDVLVTHHRAVDGSDFRRLPHPDGSFDAAAYDAPYCCPGGRKTSTVKDFHQRYGMAEGGFADPLFRNPAELQQLINDGLTEMWRLVRPSAIKAIDPVRPNGIVLAKCMSYVWGGTLWPGVHKTIAHAESLGFHLEDEFIHLGDTGPQPKTNRDGTLRRQVHARRAHSTLLVLRKLPQKPEKDQAVLELDV